MTAKHQKHIIGGLREESPNNLLKDIIHYFNLVICEFYSFFYDEKIHY